MPNRSWTAFLVAVSLACGGNSASSGSQDTRPEHEPVSPLPTAGFAGQSVALIPLSLVVGDEPVVRTPPLNDRAAALTWADSLIVATATGRAPEVKWVPPAELRKIARRSPTVAPDPDRMGQSLLRSPKLKEVPDPLRANLRSLMALAGGRFALVPAALVFVAESDGRVRAEISLALADSRTGKVVWRTLGWGIGADPDAALRAALATVFPVSLGLR